MCPARDRLKGLSGRDQLIPVAPPAAAEERSPTSLIGSLIRMSVMPNALRRPMNARSLPTRAGRAFVQSFMKVVMRIEMSSAFWSEQCAIQADGRSERGQQGVRARARAHVSNQSFLARQRPVNRT